MAMRLIDVEARRCRFAPWPCSRCWRRWRWWSGSVEHDAGVDSTADILGHPELQGFWTTGGVAFTLEKGGMYREGPFAPTPPMDLRALDAKPNILNINDPGLIVDPEPGRKLPFQARAVAKKQEING